MSPRKKPSHLATVVPLFGETTPVLIATFAAWLPDVVGDEDAHELAALMAAILELPSTANPQFDATAWVPVDAHAILAIVNNIADDDASIETMLTVTVMYLDFLAETGRWTGSDADLEHCIADLARYRPSTALTVDDIELAPVAAKDERAALNALVSVVQLRGLLDWLGDERPVTSTGVPKPAMIHEVADAVGVDLPEGLRSVRSMRDVAELRILWESAVAAGLITLMSSKAVPGHRAKSFRRGHAKDVATLRSTVAHVIAAHFEFDDVGGAFEAAGLIAMQVVLAAMTTDPAVVPRQDMPTNDEFEVVTAALVRTMLKRFESDGWLAANEHYTIAEAVRPAILRAMTQLDGHGPRGHESGLPARLAVTVRLRDTEPSITRTLELAEDLPLDAVHDVVQIAFGWENAHLHQFLGGPERNRSFYVPGEWIDESPEGSRAEHLVTIGELFRLHGDTVTYEYDFGDGWEHSITLDSELPADPQFVGALCTGGANLAPYEDSGGPWGWAEHCDAAADPKHDRHRESREWLGLRKGESLDPTEFDLSQVQSALRNLFR